MADETVSQTKYCTGCRKDLPATPHYYRRKTRSKDGWDWRCKVCVGGRYRTREHRYVVRLSPIARRFITAEQYDEVLAGQGGGCAICQRPPQGRRLDVDHSHASGLMRGLLCRSCNTAIGKLQDDPAVVERAAAYLRLHAAA